jgi:hypothetical protein
MDEILKKNIWIEKTKLKAEKGQFLQICIVIKPSFDGFITIKSILKLFYTDNPNHVFS